MSCAIQMTKIPLLACYFHQNERLSQVLLENDLQQRSSRSRASPLSFNTIRFDVNWSSLETSIHYKHMYPMYQLMTAFSIFYKNYDK